MDKELMWYIREEFSISSFELKRAIKLMEDGMCDNILIAIGYINYSQYAINVKSDRHSWNLSHGIKWAEDKIMKKPEYSKLIENNTIYKL